MDEKQEAQTVDLKQAAGITDHLVEQVGLYGEANPATVVFGYATALAAIASLLGVSDESFDEMMGLIRSAQRDAGAVAVQAEQDHRADKQRLREGE